MERPPEEAPKKNVEEEEIRRPGVSVEPPAVATIKWWSHETNRTPRPGRANPQNCAKDDPLSLGRFAVCRGRVPLPRSAFPQPLPSAPHQAPPRVALSVSPDRQFLKGDDYVLLISFI